MMQLQKTKNPTLNEPDFLFSVCWVNYFTRDDTGAPRTTIETALNGLQVPWYLNSVQYENDTGYIHYEWSVSLYG